MIATKQKRYVVGATAIGNELGCSPITVRRMIKAKRLNAFRTGNNSSPWKVWREEIERIVRQPGKQKMEPAR